MAPSAAVVSYRLGGDDGVSVESRKWTAALRELGFAVRRVAGAIEDTGEPDDIELPGLAITDPDPPDSRALRRALDGADLVIVENLCSLPLNEHAARAAAGVIAEARSRVLLRHHDLPWQRPSTDHLAAEFPPRTEGALHATVNLRSRRELLARGFAHVYAVHNRFVLDPPPGERAATRRQFGFGADDLVVFQPSRAIERKNVAGGMRFASELARRCDRDVRYWLSGPAEDGYAPTLARLVERSPVGVTCGRAGRSADAYAASDVVVFPSTWEGFGNPTIESIAARRPCAAFPYPVLSEILASGVRLFSTDQPDAVATFLRRPPEVREQYFEVNVRRARLSFAIEDLPAAIDAVFADAGWRRW